MSSDLVLVDVVGLPGPEETRPSLPRWALDQAAARGWRFFAEFCVPPEHAAPGDDWPLEPYWAVVVAKEVQLVVEGGDGPLVYQQFDLVSWTGSRMSVRLYPELLRRVMDLGERELWRHVEEAAA